jgi:hypothetical protein
LPPHAIAARRSLSPLDIHFSTKKKIMKKIALLVMLFCYSVAFAQYDPANPAPKSVLELERLPVELVQVLAETITGAELERHLTILASDEFEGRETGTEGQRKAAEYIAEIFESYELPKIGDDNSYFQKIAFTAEYWKEIEMSINGEKVKHFRDFYSFPATNSDREGISVDEVVFLGYGIDADNYSDYEGVDVAGKVILIYAGEPVDGDNISYITGTAQNSEWTTNWRKKIRLAREKGVSAVLIIDPDFRVNVDTYRREILNTRLSIGAGEDAGQNYANNCHISTNAAKMIIGKNFNKVVKARTKIQKKGEPRNMALPCDFRLTQRKQTRQLLGENVLGYIEGTDPALKDQLVVITAHYDHLGKRGNAVYNGADDNGSGTSAVLEVTQAFVEARKQGFGPRRSVLVMLVSGEEKGLLGSQYYVENPVFPLENTVVNVNVDMVGRVDEAHQGNPEYIYVIGSDRLSTELHQINETANATYTQLELDYTYNADDDPNRYYYRSDHYNFAEKGIPAIFYFSGTHEDYHQPSDTVDKIDFEKMEKIGRLVFYTSWELANRDKRIEVNVKGRN